MARHLFPLVDMVLGMPESGPSTGAPVTMPHGTVVDLFVDEECLVAADATTLGGAPISSVTVFGVTLPAFYGPDGDVFELWGKPSGAPASEAFVIRAVALPTGGGTTLPAGGVAGQYLTPSGEDPELYVWADLPEAAPGPAGPAGPAGSPGAGETIVGTGSPEGVVVANPGQQYVDSANTNGARRWEKITGTGSTGWAVDLAHAFTGIRDVSALVPPSWTFPSGGYARMWRDGRDVVFEINRATVDVAGLFPIPEGCRPASRIDSTTGTIQFYPQTLTTYWLDPSPGADRSLRLRWTTLETYPHTGDLFGDAV